MYYYKYNSRKVDILFTNIIKYNHICNVILLVYVPSVSVASNGAPKISSSMSGDEFVGLVSSISSSDSDDVGSEMGIYSSSVSDNSSPSELDGEIVSSRFAIS